MAITLSRRFTLRENVHFGVEIGPAEMRLSLASAGVETKRDDGYSGGSPAACLA